MYFLRIFKNIKYFFLLIWLKLTKRKKKQDSFLSFLPITMRIAQKTIGFDLVKVQPMSSPNTVFHYIENDNVFTRIVIVEKYKPLTFFHDDCFLIYEHPSIEHELPRGR